MKNIVICCDGTGNEYGKNNTNVVETYALAVRTATQLTYYDPGVGTGGWTYNEESGALRALTDQGTGAGLQKNVNDAYRYLMEVYEGPEANRVFLFGFSRGAFTVRSLAGMLHKVGLLERKADNQLEYAAKIYNQPRNARVAAGFKATFSRPAPVHFIGVWDTVESLVLNEGKRWVDARLNTDTSFAYHALAIDEKRRDFQPCLWDERNRGTGADHGAGVVRRRALRRGGLSPGTRPGQHLAALDARQGRGGGAGDQPAPPAQPALPA